MKKLEYKPKERVWSLVFVPSQLLLQHYTFMSPVTFDDSHRETGHTIVPVRVVQQLLSLPLVLLRTPQLPCKQTHVTFSHSLCRNKQSVYFNMRNLFYLVFGM